MSLLKFVIKILIISVVFLITSCIYMSKPIPPEEQPREESAFEDYSQALILSETGDLDKALVKINSAIAANRKISKFFLLKAEILEKKDEPIQALAIYEEVLKLKSYNPAVYEKIGRLLANVGQYHNAIQNIKKAYSQNPDANYFLLLIAEYYVELKTFDRAEDYLTLYKNQVKASSMSGDYYCIQSEIFYHEGNFEDAINAINKCRASKTLTTKENKLLLNAYLNSGQYDKLYSDLISLNNEVLSNGDMHFYRGVYYFYKKSYQDALSQLEFALQFGTSETRVYYYLGKTYLELGQASKSKEMFELYRSKAEEPQLEDIKIKELDGAGF
jgi:tetratricopeptide (TPR) repeat protein